MINEIVKKIEGMMYPDKTNDYTRGHNKALNDVKEIILAEKKEPCGWCSKWRLEFNAIDDEGNTITTDDHMIMGGVADYCPVCGKYIGEEAD